MLGDNCTRQNDSREQERKEAKGSKSTRDQSRTVSQRDKKKWRNEDTTCGYK